MSSDTQITQALRHPALRTIVKDPPRFEVPTPRIPKTIPEDVLLDIAFLAYTMEDFALCQSLAVIEEGIITLGVPWMTRWVSMLGSWKARAETMWEDVKTSPSSRTARCESAGSAIGVDCDQLTFSANDQEQEGCYKGEPKELAAFAGHSAFA